MASTNTHPHPQPDPQPQSQAQAQQPVTFTTTTPYPLPSQKFMIPLGWRRYQLSQLVNKALALDRGGEGEGDGARPVPFDFLVRGELLRGSLAEWCREKGVGEEETLEIEYIESVMPPQKMSDFPHEDWVAAVSCYIPGFFLTASYDGHLRAFDYAHNLCFDRAVHNVGAAMTALCVVPFPSPSLNGDGGEDGDGGETYTIATASHDASAQILRVTLPSPSPSSSSSSANPNGTLKAKAHSKAQPLASLYLHTAPIASVTASAGGTRLLTAGWDGLVGVWAWDGERVVRDEVDVPAFPGVGVDGARDRKRRRVGAGEEKDGEDGGWGKEERPGRKAPAAVLKSHVGRVSKALFLGPAEEDANGDGNGNGNGNENEKAVSCGFDSTVRTWDVEYGVCVGTINASEKPFLDLSPLAPSAPSSPYTSVLATSTDRTMCLYDLRLPTTSTTSSSGTLSSAPAASFAHPSTPSCVRASRGNAYHAITGSYDGVVRVWDVRSVKGAVASFKVGDAGAAPAGQGQGQGGQGKGKGKGGKVLGVDWARGVVGVGGEFGMEVWRVGEDGGVRGRM